MTDNNQLTTPGLGEGSVDQLDPLDRGEASSLPETTSVETEVSLLDLENTGNNVHRRSEEFHQTEMQDAEAVFRTRRDYERQESYEFVKREQIGEKEEGRKERLKSKTLILLEQAAADICASKRRFPKVFGEIMRAFDNSNNLAQKEQLEIIKNDLTKLKIDLRQIAQMYFLESVLLLRQFKRLFPEEFHSSENNPGSIELIMQEFYLRVGKDTANQAKLEYFPEVLSESIEQIMTDERLDDTEQDLNQYILLLEKQNERENPEKEKAEIENRLHSTHEALKLEMAVDQKAKQDFHDDERGGEGGEEQTAQAA